MVVHPTFKELLWPVGIGFLRARSTCAFANSEKADHDINAVLAALLLTVKLVAEGTLALSVHVSEQPCKIVF